MININTVKLENKILEYLKNQSGEISFLLKDLKSSKIILSQSQNKKVSSASIIKVLIMIAVFKEVEKRNISLNTNITITNKFEDSHLSELLSDKISILELVKYMIAISDNTATNILIDYLGFEKINEYAKIFSMNNTELNRKMLDFKSLKLGINNYTSLFDMDILLTKLYNKEILNNYNGTFLADLAIEILISQRHKDLLTRYIFTDVKIAHKTGSLDNLRHDIGIFYGKTPYLFGIFITDANEDEAEKTIGIISKMVYEYMEYDFV